MSHSTLEIYYRMIFGLCQYHKWDIASVENLIPFELQIYIDLIKESMEKSQQQSDGGFSEMVKELRSNG